MHSIYVDADFTDDERRAKLYDGDLFVSHSNADKLCPHPRNLTDDQIKRIAAKGGVVMINFGSTFLEQKIGRASCRERV